MQAKGHIVAIRLSAMGDVAMTVPVINSFLKKYPNYKISIVVKDWLAPIFATNPKINIIPVSTKGRHKGLGGLMKLFKEIKSQEPTQVLDLHNVLRSNILLTLFRLNGIPVQQIDKGRKEKKALTRSQNKHFVQLKTTIERYSEVFQKAGFPVNPGQDPFFKRQAIPKGLISIIQGKNHAWLGIAPFAAHGSKQYSLTLMQEVIRLVKEKKECEIFLFGGGQKEEKALASLAEGNSRIHNVANKFSLADELSLISNLDLMLSMDSGNGHLAANYAVPVVTVWGVTHPFAGFAPYQQPLSNCILPSRDQFPLIPTSIYGNKHPAGYERAIDTISPADIAEKIIGLLSKDR